jgi:hypothetical protein
VPQLTPAPPGPLASHDALARHYAPTIHQGTASDQDFVTAADFDGDWIGSNNWQNQPSGDLAAYVYYSVIETETHWYLFYSLFHPRDYTQKPCEESDGCHENDMESLQVVVAKDGSSFGRPLALETLAHSHLYLYSFEDSAKKGALRVRGRVTQEGSHPIVWVETYGHGIHGQRLRLRPSAVVYRVGDVAETPESLDDEHVSYRLVPIYDTLWQQRDDVGPGRAFDNPFDYRGCTLPYSFDGDDWGEDKDSLSRGDWFLDPARALAFHATLKDQLSTRYVHNPFLVDLGLLEKP